MSDISSEITGMFIEEENKKDKMKEYLWDKIFEGNYLLEYVENTDLRVVRHEVNYPIKGDINGWYFFTSKTIEGKDFAHESWDLPIEEQEEIKAYIRDVLKPSDLYEEDEVNKMDGMRVLNVAVPTDLADEVMSIIGRFDGVPIDGDINLSAVQELEVCKADKENLLNELRQANFRADENKRAFENVLDDATICIQSICDDMQNTLDRYAFREFMDRFTDEQIEKFGLKKYKKYQVTKVKATKTITTDIYVLEKDDDNFNPEGVLESADEELIDGFFQDYLLEYKFDFEARSVSADGLTKEEVLKRYSQEELFTADDCNDVWD